VPSVTVCSIPIHRCHNGYQRLQPQLRTEQFAPAIRCLSTSTRVGLDQQAGLLVAHAPLLELSGVSNAKKYLRPLAQQLLAQGGLVQNNSACVVGGCDAAFQLVAGRRASRTRWCSAATNRDQILTCRVALTAASITSFNHFCLIQFAPSRCPPQGNARRTAFSITRFNSWPETAVEGVGGRSSTSSSCTCSKSGRAALKARSS